MTNDTRSPDEIERDIESRRSDLSSNLDALQDKFSLDTMVRQLGDQFREHGGDLGKSITEQVKANPIPLALTGIGLAWLMMGNSQKPATRSHGVDQEDDYRRSRLDAGRPYTPPSAGIPPRGPVPAWADDDDMGYADRSPTRPTHDTGLRSAGMGTGSTQSAMPGSSTGYTSSPGSTSAPVSDASDDGDGRMARARQRLSEGTENLSEEGRKRVIAARQRAVEMRRSTMRSVQSGSDAAADFYEQQPLVIGALALAVGAALGGALPRTRMEDDAMGDQSDALIREAEAIFEEERAKAEKVVKAAADEANTIASETKDEMDREAPGDRTAAQAAGDKAAESAQRVADRAKSTAEDENLGKPQS